MVFLEIRRWYFKGFTDGIFGDSKVVFWRFRGGFVRDSEMACWKFRGGIFEDSAVVFLEILKWYFWRQQCDYEWTVPDQ